MAPIVTTYMITGAGRGLGRGFVEAYLQRDNVKVFAGVRSPGSSEALQQLVREYGSKLTLIELELTDEDSIKAAAAQVSAACPDGLDVLVNNGGHLGDTVAGDVFGPTAGDFLNVLNINVVSMYLMCKHFRPLLLKGLAKKIVNTSSTAARLSSQYAAIGKHTPGAPRFPAMLPYKTSKAAVNMQTVVMADELHEEGITVVAIHPGFVATDMGNAAGAPAGITPGMSIAESIAAQVATIDRLTLKDSGSYLNYDGSKLDF